MSAIEKNYNKNDVQKCKQITKKKAVIDIKLK